MMRVRLSLALVLLASLSEAVVAEGPIPLSAGKSDPHTYVEPTRAEKLEACMLLWEEVNHIGKKRWRELCKEQENAKQPAGDLRTEP